MSLLRKQEVLRGKHRVSYQQDMQLSIWAKFEAVMNNSISFGGVEFLGGINNGQAFFLAPLPLLTPVSTVLVSHLWQRSEQVGEGTKKEKERGGWASPLYPEQIAAMDSAAHKCASRVEVQASNCLWLGCSEVQGDLGG